MSSAAGRSGGEHIEVELPGARAAFTTRRGGVSDGPYESLNLGILTDDDPARVARNRELAAAGAGLDPDRIGMGWQVHGAELKEWRSGDDAAFAARAAAVTGDLDAAARRGAGAGNLDAAARPATGTDDLDRVDAHATGLAGLALLVLVADCVPVALAAPGRVAILHCGWRGLAEDVVERALATFETPPAAAIGPAIGRCCYEVGPEVLERFRDLDGVADGSMLDLKAVAARRLAAGGARSIEDVGLCTSCRADLFFSHRRDRGVTGRQAGIVWRVS